MKKSDLITRVANASGQSETTAGRAVDLVFDTIGAALARGATVMTKRFGTFYTTELPARAGRNPKTGVAVAIPASRRPWFRVARALKDVVQG